MISDVICDTCQKLSYHRTYNGQDMVSIWTLDLYLLENNIKNSENPHGLQRDIKKTFLTPDFWSTKVKNVFYAEIS